MFKKAMLIAAFILFTSFLVYGAVNRTLASNTKQTHVATGQGVDRAQGSGQTSTGERQYRNSHEPLNQGGQLDQQNLNDHEPLNQGGSQERQGQGRQSGNDQQPGQAAGGQGQNRQSEEVRPFNQPAQGQGNGAQGQSQSGNGRQQENRSDAPIETTTLSGIVAQAPSTGIELILQTSAGDVQVGTGPDYLGEIGIVLQVGDEVSVSGYWEDGEFKASAITMLADGTTVPLRDESGRPMWSGAARGGRGGQSGGA